MALQFLGEPGNIAARLQGLTKKKNCTMIVSAATIAAGGWDRITWQSDEVDVRGVDAKISIFLIDRREALAQLLNV
jgi:adenylate cyclase